MGARIPVTLRHRLNSDGTSRFNLLRVELTESFQQAKMAMDMFEWCSQHAPLHYPITVSGYHIKQKGATPIQQAAFTLANGFVYVDEALQRGMDINTIGKRLPFFFTSGMDFEYIALLSAVRRVWAVALRDANGADDPGAQKLKAHVQKRKMQFGSRRTPRPFCLRRWGDLRT